MSRARYTTKVMTLSKPNLIGYWRLGGYSNIAHDWSGNELHGSHTAVTMGLNYGIGDGLSSSNYDGVTSFSNIFSTGLVSKFNSSEGTLLLWAKVDSSLRWTDTAGRTLIHLGSNPNNRVFIVKPVGSSNQMNVQYNANGVASAISINPITTINFFQIGVSWSSSKDQLKMYVNGVQNGSPVTGLGVWAGLLTSNLCYIGISQTPSATSWFGNVAHVSLWNTVLTDNQIASLFVVP